MRLRPTPASPVDLKIVAPDQFGNLLQHFTGSKEHNMALRDAAVRRGLHVSEYGVLDDATGETHRCATEAEVYALLGLEYIEPELRENRGELEAAAAGTLPELIDRRGPPGRSALPHHRLRRHRLDRRDGGGRPRRRATSTSRSPTTRRASASARTSRPIGCAATSSAIRSTEVDGIELLAGCEVNILPDGSLDYDDDVLAELDWVIASVHSSFRHGAREAMTERIVRGDRAPARRRDRPPLGAQDRAPGAVRSSTPRR